MSPDANVKGHDTRWKCIPWTFCLQTWKIPWQKWRAQRWRPDTGIWIRAEVPSSFYHLNPFSQSHRICVGQHVASATVSTHQGFIIFSSAKMTPSEQLWLTIASILATFHIGKARDNSGKEIAVSDEYEDLGLVKWASYSAASFALMCMISPAARNILTVQSNPDPTNIVS